MDKRFIKIQKSDAGPVMKTITKIELSGLTAKNPPQTQGDSTEDHYSYNFQPRKRGICMDYNP